MKLIRMLGEYALTSLVSLADNASYLLVDESCGIVGIILAGREISAEEYLVLRMLRAVKNSTELVAHTVSRYHVSCDSGRLLNIVRCARRNVIKNKLLCNSSTKAQNDTVEHLVSR